VLNCLRLFFTLIGLTLMVNIKAEAATPPRSDHFDGSRYHNPSLAEPKGFSDFIKWQWTRSSKDWPDYIDDVKPVVPSEIGLTQARLTFVNHATALIQFGSTNILTDPIWSKRAGPFSFAGPKRVRAPGIKIEDLPQIHVILLSHNHYDHMDISTLQTLHKKYNPRIFVPLGNKSLLEDSGITNVEEFDWGEQRVVAEIIFTFEKALHWSGRGIFDRFKSLWGSWVIASSSKKIYFAGDTGYSSHFSEISKKHGAFDLAMLPIGAYEPRWFMRDFHMNPDDAIVAHKEINTKKSVGIHFGTFQLTDEGVEDPAKDLATARTQNNLPEIDFIAPYHGQSFEF
jgi:L-ascorbate metabolism protein UlaG (beta-lactamase superfamily)